MQLNPYDLSPDEDERMRRISVLVASWPDEIRAAEQAVREARQTLMGLRDLWDAEIVESMTDFDAADDFDEVERRLRSLGRIAQARVQVDKDAEAARLKTRVSELEARLAKAPYVPADGDMIVFPDAPQHTDRLPVHVVTGVSEDGTSFRCRWTGVDGAVEGQFTPAEARNLGVRLANRDELALLAKEMS